MWAKPFSLWLKFRCSVWTLLNLTTSIEQVCTWVGGSAVVGSLVNWSQDPHLLEFTQSNPLPARLAWAWWFASSKVEYRESDGMSLVRFGCKGLGLCDFCLAHTHTLVKLVYRELPRERPTWPGTVGCLYIEMQLIFVGASYMQNTLRCLSVIIVYLLDFLWSEYTVHK